MDEHRVDPATIKVWRLQAMLIVLALTVAGVGVVIVSSARAMLLLPVAAAVVAVVAAWRLPSIHYHALSFAVDDVGIAIRSGPWWRSHVALPRQRIQHTDVSQGPLQRRYGVATLKLYTAGSRHTQIDLPGLAYDDAIALRDTLIANPGKDSGV